MRPELEFRLRVWDLGFRVWDFFLHLHIGAIIIRIGFGGISYYNYHEELPKSCR